VAPNCSASATSSRPDRRRNRAVRLLQRRRLQQHRSLLGLEPVDDVVTRQGMGRIWSARAHTRTRRSFRIHSENTRCATGVRRRGRTRFPISEISRHSNGEQACAIRCTGRTPRSGACNTSDRRLPESVTRAEGGAALAALARFGIRINAWFGDSLGRGFDPSQRERPVCGWRLLVATTKRQG
jgi:hypothetical protein